jgi:hypothetical protein
VQNKDQAPKVEIHINHLKLEPLYIEMGRQMNTSTDLDFFIQGKSMDLSMFTAN